MTEKSESNNSSMTVILRDCQNSGPGTRSNAIGNGDLKFFSCDTCGHVISLPTLQQEFINLASQQNP